MRPPLPFLAIFAFALILIQPLFNPNLICADDLQAHLRKAYALELALQRGDYIPRWVPEMSRGYGYPLFNFYAPLSSYPLVAIHLFGAPYPIAILIVLTLYVYLAGAGMFLFARDLLDDKAAFVSALAYMSAPYMAYDIVFRGALAEVSGWMWIPLALWAVRRAMSRASWRWAVLGALCYAALLPSHNLLALISTPLLGGWVMAQALESKAWLRLRFGMAALGLGLAIAAWFWLPVFVERGEVRTDRLLDSTVLQYANNFIDPSELSQPWTADPLLMNPSPTRGLGLITCVLAGLGALTLFRRFRLSVLYLALATIFYCGLTLSISQPLWEITPLMPFFQFPWRMLTPAAFGAAALVGVLFFETPYLASGRGLWLASGVLILFNLSWWQPTYCGVMPPLTPAALNQFRAETYMEGAHSYSEYLPTGVKTFPQDEALFKALVQGERPDRLVVANALVASRSTNPLRAEYEITVSQTTEAIYKQFYYPGWQVIVDGQAIEIYPPDESGLIKFVLTPGAHHVWVQFKETPWRWFADIISILALVGCGAILLRRQETPQTPGALQPFKASLWLSLIILALALFALRVFVLGDSRRSLFDGERVANAQPLQASLAGGVELYGYQVDSTVSAGAGFEVTLYAGVREKVDGAFVPTMSLEDDTGLRWSAAEVAFPRWLRPPFSANLWEPNKYALWARRLTVLPGTPPGTYRLWGTVFDANHPALIASVIDTQGNPLAPRFALGQIRVTRPPKPASMEALQMQNVSNVKLNDSLRLLGWQADRSEALAGETMLLTLFWKMEKETAQAQSLEISLTDEQGQTVFTNEVTPVRADFPTSQWKQGEVWRGQHWLLLPATLKDGGYRWTVTVKGEGAAATLGRVRVTAPQRSFVAPPFDQKVGARFDQFAELAGYSLKGDKLVLVWHALQTPQKSYTVFVHVVNGERVWAQSDGVPQNWSRPTTGWLAGEYVLDERTLALPADAPRGEYPIYVGLVELGTGQRVKINDAEDRFPVGVLSK